MSISHHTSGDDLMGGRSDHPDGANPECKIVAWRKHGVDFLKHAGTRLATKDYLDPNAVLAPWMSPAIHV